jgi:hypothetical protein
MPDVPNSDQRRFKDVMGFTDGVNSYLAPQLIKDTQLRWAENAVNKGEIWQCRPGFKALLALCTVPGAPLYDWWYNLGDPNPLYFLRGPPGVPRLINQPVLNPQFFTIWTPTGGSPQAVFGLNGSVFFAPMLENGGFDTPRQIIGLQFDPNVAQITATSCVKSADLVAFKIKPITPYNVLMFQDGLSRAGYWDGTGAGQLNPQKLYTVDKTGNTDYVSGYNETRIGKYQAWSGNRLWVWNGTEGHVSDINDPFHFTEECVLTNVPAFYVPDPVTMVIDRGVSGVQENRVFVCTAKQTWTFRSGIQDRTTWGATQDFQRLTFNEVGCVAAKSAVNHRGLLFWYSESGIVKFDSFGTITNTQSLPPIDSEMAFSKLRMATDRSSICAGHFDSYVFWGVPVGPTQNGRIVNGQIQVLDRNVIPMTAGIAGTTYFVYEYAAWQGVWTGIRPIEWCTAQVYGRTRCFCLSMDYDGVPRIWEAFQGNRCDNGQPIKWFLETKTHPVTESPFVTDVFRHFRVLLSEVRGTLNITGFWKGMRGVYHQLLETVITAAPGSLFLTGGPSTPLLRDTPVTSYDKQFRELISEDNRQITAGSCQSAGVESTKTDGEDRAFSLLLKFQGVGAMFAYRIATDKTPQKQEGMVMTDEIGLKILPDAGCPQYLPGALQTFVLGDAPPAMATMPTTPCYVEDAYVSPVDPCAPEM